MLIDFVMTPSGSAVLHPQPVEPTVDPKPSTPAKFDSAFLDRRMAEHRAWLERMRPYPRAVPEEKQDFCPKCQSMQRFVFDRECTDGVVGICKGCGDEYVRPFTHTITEVA